MGVPGPLGVQTLLDVLLVRGDRGTSSSYTWVILYTGANYTGTGYCVAQHGGSWSDLNVRIRSHRWSATC